MVELRNIADVGRILREVGWFLPPFIQVGALHELCDKIESANGEFTQDQLGNELAAIYSEVALASMVLLRYPQAPVICDYSEAISEAVLGVNAD